MIAASQFSKINLLPKAVELLKKYHNQGRDIGSYSVQGDVLNSVEINISELDREKVKFYNN